MRMGALCLILGAAQLATATLQAGAIPGDLALTPVVTSGIGSPIGVRNAGDGSGRLFIIGRDGLIWIKPSGSNAVLPTPFLNIDPLVVINGESGLLGLAFDPDYASNRRFYVSYVDNNIDTVIARYTAMAGNPDVADPASATILIRVDQGSGFHKGGDLHFGHDGYLYIGLGDGAEGVSIDHCRRAQSLTPQDVFDNDDPPPGPGHCTGDGNFVGSLRSRALLGKMLRIDVAGTTPAGSNELCAANVDGSANYAIPPANPFAGSNGGAGRCDEIFAWGLRNPFRFSVDYETGDLFIGDVGESRMEEVDFVPAVSPGGINFGWPQCEGTIAVPGQVGGCSGSTAPIFIDDHDISGNCSITGGYRYRGAITGLRGTYIFSDYCSGRIRFAEESGGNWSYSEWLNGPNFQHSSFGEDEDGELYLVEINNDQVLRFTSSETGPPSAIFADGFED